MTTPSDIFIFPIQDFVGDGPQHYDEVNAWLNAKPEFPGGYFANTSTWSPEMCAWFASVHSDPRNIGDEPIYDEVAGELRYLPTLTDDEWDAVIDDLRDNPDWTNTDWRPDPLIVHSEDDDLGHLLNPFAD